MKRKIIQIEEEKCNGCALCAGACHEGAIGIVNGKAKLLREDYCDGLGDCLPVCPTGAITFVEREARPYDAAAVQQAKAVEKAEARDAISGCLENFPVQLKLVPVNAPYFEDAHLLIAADCTAFAYGDFHRDFIAGKVTLIGCPKLDGVSYGEKLARIFRENRIRKITVTRMVVPCCGGLPFAVKSALEQSGKQIPLEIVTMAPDGRIREREVL